MNDAPEIEVVLPRSVIGAVPVAWTFAVAVYVGTQVWIALSVGRELGIDSPDNNKWVRMAFLSQTGGLTVALGALGGLLLVVLAGPARARAASVLGIAIGLWIAVAGAMGMAVAIHGHTTFLSSSFAGNRFVFGLANAANFVLGALVVVLGARLLSAGGGLVDRAPANEVELTELS